MFTHQMEANEYLADSSDLPASDIAGTVMFDALVRILPYVRDSQSLTDRKKKIVLRQIAKQAEKIAKSPELQASLNIKFPPEWNMADRVGMTKVAILETLKVVPKVKEAVIKELGLLKTFKKLMESERGSIKFPTKGSFINHEGNIGKVVSVKGNQVKFQFLNEAGRTVVTSLKDLIYKPGVYKEHEFDVDEEGIAVSKEIKKTELSQHGFSPEALG